MLLGFILCPSYEEKFINYLKGYLNFKINNIVLSQDGFLLLDIKINDIESNNDKITFEKLINNSIFPYLVFYNFKEININEINIDNLAKNFLNIICLEFLSFIKNKVIDENIFFNVYKHNKNNKIVIDKNFNFLLKESLKKKVSKVTKYFVTDFNLLQFNNFNDYKKERISLFVLFYENKLFYSFNLFYNGQKRMKFEKEAPSRSFLKIEEAFKILCEQPSEYSIVFDLGASPGGWSYSCLKKGATIYAIDNGKLKGKYLQDKIRNYELFHIKYDGFKFNPEKNNLNIKLNKNILISNTKNKLSWFLCDIVEKPEKIVKLAQKWITNKWAYYYIINFKLGYSDIKNILSEINKLGFLNYFENYRFVHLFSDREEITFLGKIRN